MINDSSADYVSLLVVFTKKKIEVPSSISMLFDLKKRTHVPFCVRMVASTLT